MSAFEPHVIAVEWVGVNSGLTGTMNEISGGLTNLGRQQQQFGRQSGQTFGYWSQQARVARRSLEYMVAGMGMYKVMQAFQNYRQFRTELGYLNANLQVGQGQLNQWGNAAIDISNRTATPLDQVVQSFQNLAASFPDVNAKAKQYLFPAMAEIEAKASGILGGQVEPQQFGATILQAARSFYGAQAVQRTVMRNPRGRNDLERIATAVINTYQQVPGTTGQALISYLPTLFQGARAGGFSPEQTLAMFTVAQRVMGRPAQTMQYLRQLQFRLKRPTPQAAQFLQQSGIIGSQKDLYNMSGWDIMMRILHHAAGLPGGVSQQQLRQMASSGNLQDVHLRGQAAQFLTQALGGKTGAGRMQSLFALQALSTGLPDLNREVTKLTHNSRSLNDMFGKVLAQRQLSQAGIQISNTATQFINSFTPLINIVAKFSGHLATATTDLIRLSGRALDFTGRMTHGVIGHRTATYAETFGLAYALRAGLPPGIGNTLGRIPGVGRLLKPIFQMTGREKGLFGRVFSRGAGRAAGEAADVAESRAAPGLLAKTFQYAINGPLDIQAMSHALSGMANGSPTAPFWVVIHPLSRSTVPALFGYGPNAPTGLTNKIETTTKTKVEQSALNKAIRIFTNPAAAGVEGAAGTAGLSALGASAATTAGLAALPLTGLGYDIWKMTHYHAPHIRPLTRAQQRSLHRDRGHFFEKVFDPHNRSGWMRNAQDIPAIHSYLQATGGRVPLGLQSYFDRYNQHHLSSRQLQRDLYGYARQNLRALRHPMTPNQANAFYRYVDPIFNLGNRTRFIHQATRQGGFEGYADVAIELQPTQELKQLVKPPQRKVHVRVPITHSPTQRGGRPTHRNR